MHDLSGSVLTAQELLDADYAQRLNEFSALTRLAAGTGFESLAQSLAPAPLAMVEAEVQCHFVFTRSTERDFSIRVLNAAWTSRFRTETSRQQTLRFQVKRAPAPVDHAANSPI